MRGEAEIEGNSAPSSPAIPVASIEQRGLLLQSPEAPDGKRERLLERNRLQESSRRGIPSKQE